MTLIAFEGVSKRYRRGWRETVAVLDDVSFEIEPGDYVGVWGRHGAGKSTLLLLCAAMEFPDSGRVRFDGRDTAEMSNRGRALLLRSDIGYASTSFGHEQGHVMRAERVVDHVSVPLVGEGRTPVEARAAARAALNRVGAAGCVDAGLHELGPGERTLVALARAMSREPRLLLVDEPEVCPSPEEREAIRRLLRSLGREAGLTVVVASASPGAMRGARRLFSIGHGRLLAEERPGTVVPLRADRAGGGETR